MENRLYVFVDDSCSFQDRFFPKNFDELESYVINVFEYWSSIYIEHKVYIVVDIETTKEYYDLTYLKYFMICVVNSNPDWSCNFSLIHKVYKECSFHYLKDVCDRFDLTKYLERRSRM